MCKIKHRGYNMNLGELIEYLENKDKSIIILRGFGKANSYRGYYEQIAFTPKNNVTVGDMLAEAKKALGSMYQGYKGGRYVMDEYTEVWICEPGTMFQNQKIGKLLLDYMMGIGPADN